MKVNVAESEYREAQREPGEFSRKEVRYLRSLLRRLRFLEAKIRTWDGPVDSESLVFDEREQEALEWILRDVGFLEEGEKK